MATDLLQELLARMYNEQFRTLPELAQELDVDQMLLEQMLWDLERSGYLRLVGSVCRGQCGRCGKQEQCAPLAGGRTWTVTEKGLRVAKKTN